MGKQWTPPANDTPVDNNRWTPPATDIPVQPQKKSSDQTGLPKSAEDWQHILSHQDSESAHRPQPKINWSKQDLDNAIKSMQDFRNKQKDEREDYNSDYYAKLAERERNAPEGSWKNTLPVVTHALTEMITKPLAGTTKIVRDLIGKADKKTTAAKPLYDENGELTDYGKQVNEGKGHDILGKLAIGLDAYNKNVEQADQQKPLPNTILGNTATGVVNLAPDVISTAVFTEEKVGASLLERMAFNPFNKVLTVKGGLNAYSNAEQQGATPTKAAVEGLKGAAKAEVEATAMNALSGIGHTVAPKMVEKLSDAGLIKDNVLTQKGSAAVTNAALFGAYPIASNLIQGKPFNKAETEGGIGMGILFGLTGGSPQKAEETRQALAVQNFMNASPEAIKAAHELPEQTANINAQAVEQAAKYNENQLPEHAAAASTLTKTADVKGTTEAILKDKDAFVNHIEQSDLPDEVKTQVIAKANDVHKALDPTEQKKTEIGNKIQEIDDMVKSIGENKSEDPVEQAENDVRLETLNKHRDELTDELKNIILKKYEQPKSDKEVSTEQPTGTTGKAEETTDTTNATTKNQTIKSENNEKENEQGGVAERPANSSESEKESSQNQKGDAELNRQENGGEKESRNVSNSGTDKTVPELKKSNVPKFSELYKVGNVINYDGDKVRINKINIGENGTITVRGENITQKQPWMWSFTKEEASDHYSLYQNLDFNNKENEPINEGKKSEGSEQQHIGTAHGEDVPKNEKEVREEDRRQASDSNSLSGEKEVKKTILTKRAYEGDISGSVKKHLEEKGLTRKTFSQAERSKQAEDFIDKFGEEATYHAIKSGDMEGALASSALAKLIKRTSREIDADPENEDLAKKQADLIHLQEQKGYAAGEYVGQLAHEYQDEDLGYANVKKLVQEKTGKVTAEQENRIKDLTSKNIALEKELSDYEAKLIEETDKAFNEGRESGKNETKADKAKRIADKVRKAKIHRPGIFSSATPATIAWDGAVEAVASTIEAGGKIADAIQKGVDHIKESGWYKGLSDDKKTEAEQEFVRYHRDTVGSQSLEDLQERFADKKGNKFEPQEARDIWNYMKERYLENGNSFPDAIAKVSRDLGLTWRQVSEAITTPKNKRASDEMWKKQSESARQRTAIRNWISDQSDSAPVKALKKISGAFRGIAVFGHGGIFVGTHAGMNLFNPTTWNKVVPAFFRGWNYAYGSEAAYARGMEELKNSPNYLLAQRAGLKNEPERINTEEFQKSQKYTEQFGDWIKKQGAEKLGEGVKRSGLAGERGFNAIKVLRQDLFDYHYNRLDAADKEDPEVAKSIANIINLATGATTLRIPNWVNEASFAGGMEAARWQKLLQSPAKATAILTKVITNPTEVSAGDKVFAKVWAKRAGIQIATMTTALAVNAAIQKIVDPNNPVNITNPNAPDWLKFKFGKTSLDPTSGMRSSAQFLYTLGKIPLDKEKNNDKRLQTLGKKLAQYGRGKLAPFYGTLADFYTSRDYNGNPLPWSSDKPGKYNHKLGYVEYGTSKLPLPLAESMGVFYKSAKENGADDATLNAIISGIVSGSTGFRVSEDKPKKNTFSIKN